MTIVSEGRGCRPLLWLAEVGEFAVVLCCGLAIGRVSFQLCIEATNAGVFAVNSYLSSPLIARRIP